ncbi:hypothetical protein MMYC01_209378 [Madurella mycetomatis]|uniref:Uncharacterized protein n=1 Tax=Madurella mycetomatis TaxID=100816 RepID=A0A175VQB8_9PEZI|nr:hypothetical protein MMYC01_209378 [Madurella mycetomatis]
MDLPVHWTLDFLKDLLPPETLTHLYDLKTRLLEPSSPIHRLSAALSSLAAAMAPILGTALDRLLALLSASPNVVAVALLLVVAVVVLQILSIIRRIMLFWTRLAMRLLFWSVVAVVASMVWQRGVAESVQDTVYWAGRAIGLLGGMVEVWLREYENAQRGGQHQQHQQQPGGYGYLQGK